MIKVLYLKLTNENSDMNFKHSCFKDKLYNTFLHLKAKFNTAFKGLMGDEVTKLTYLG